ncbi:MAG: tyrosine-type recombinase/integrase [Tepidisphaeraceae bacterium]
MATIGNDPNGRKRILFVAGDGKRRTIRLGKATQRQAEGFKVKVEALIGASLSGSIDDEVSRWLASRDDKTYARLAAVGLVRPRVTTGAELGAFFDTFTKSRPTVKPGTLLNEKQLRDWLVKFFGETRDLRTIGPADAENFRTFMDEQGLGDNTIRRHIGRARQLFKAAIRRGLIRGANPFDGLSGTVKGDMSRLFFVTREVATKVIDACPDAQWKLLFALCRYGGLRCPSEPLALKWSDVDWEHNRLRVPSPKTEHIKGKECRIIPLFPELRPLLLEVFEQAEEGTEYVITRYRDRNCNLRTQLERIIRDKAKLVPWPKPFQNLRSTRETELAEVYPIHVVCAWIGNSEAVAKRHYLQITDAHFLKASSPISPPSPISPASPTATPSPTCEGKAAQNPAQSAAAPSCHEPTTTGASVENRPKSQELALAGSSGQDGKYPRQDSNL